MKVKTDEIAKNVFRIAVLPPGSFISFNHYLLKGHGGSALVHAGHQSTFETVKEQISTIIPLSNLQALFFSHFESDECGSLNHWLGLLPDLTAYTNKICNFSIQEFAIRPAKLFKDGDKLEFGEHRLTMMETPHFPHNWDASLFFEENTRTLFCSDVATQTGFPQEHNEPADLEAILKLQDNLRYIPYGQQTSLGIDRLSRLDFQRMAVMHGSIVERAQGLDLLKQLENNNSEALQQSQTLKAH